MTTKRLIKISFPIILLLGIYFLGPRQTSQCIARQCQPSLMTLTRWRSTSPIRNSNIKSNPIMKHGLFGLTAAARRLHIQLCIYMGSRRVRQRVIATHRRFAKEFGCNLFLSRLADHGIDTTEALLQFTPDRVWESAKEALAIGKKLGDKVIVLSTSTGGTLALMLAAEYPQDVFALINLSPNIAINDGAAFILNDPWGLQIARMVMGGNVSRYRRKRRAREILE